MLDAERHFLPPDLPYGVPSSIRLTGHSRGGPLQIGRRWSAPIAPATITLSCDEPPCAELPSARGSSLRGEDGHHAGARLRCGVDGDPPTLSVRVEGRLPPGEYAGSVLLSVADRRALIPVRVAVAAWWPWMVLPLLLGVLLLSTMSFIAEQRQLAEARAQAFEIREGLAALRPRIALGPPQWHRLAADAEQSVDAALRILAEPRPLSLRDPRPARAARHTDAARADLDRLRELLPAAAAGSDDIRWLAQAWEDAGDQLAGVRERFAALSGTGTPAQDPLGQALTTLLRQLAERLVLPLADLIDQDIGLQVDRALMLAQSGRPLQARRLAALTHDALQAGLRILVDNMDLTLSLGATAREIHQRRALIQELLDRAGLAAADRREIEEAVEAAVDTFLLEPNLEGLRALHATLNRTQVELLRKHQALTYVALDAAKAQALQDTSIAAIEAAFEAMTPTSNPAEKRRNLRQVQALWRERVATFAGPRAAEMTAILERMTGELQRWEPEALAASSKALVDSWSSYVDERVTALMAVPAGDFCALHARSATLALDANATQLALLKPNDRTRDLQTRLDRLRYQLERLPKDADCVAVLTDIGDENLVIGDRLMEDQFSDLRVLLEPGIEAVRQAGFDELAARLGRLLTEPRTLGVSVRTPPAARVADAALEIEITDLDPAWGPSARVVIDFGDGTRLESDAERLREAGTLVHRYTLPGEYVLRVQVDLGTPGQSGDAPQLGSGEGTIAIARSPIGEARSVVLGLLNARTLLALLVAWILQTVRLSARGPFGAQATDYFEAFAIGAGSQAGLEGLLSIVSN